MPDINVPSIDPSRVLTKWQNKQRVATWVQTNKKYLNKVRKTYTNVGYGKGELRKLALGDTELLKQALRFQKYEDFRGVAQSYGYVDKGEKGTRLRKEMKWLSSNFNSPDQAASYLEAKGSLAANMDKINDYLRATGQAELSVDKTGIKNLAKVDSNRYLWERRLAGMTADAQLVLSNVDSYSQWANTFTSYGDAKPTWEQVRGAIKQYGSVGNYQKYREAQGDVAALSEDVIDFFGDEAANLTAAYAGNTAYQSMLTEINNFAEFNPAYKARFGANVSRDTLSGLAAQYQTGANYQRFLGAQDTAAAMQPELADLDLWGFEPMSPEALADMIYSGQEATLEEKKNAARLRRRNAFTEGKSSVATELTEGGLLKQNLF